MGFLTLENILQANDLEAVEIEVPEWGGAVLARPLTAAELEHLLDKAPNGGVQYGKLLIAASLVEPKLTQEQVTALWAQKNGMVMVNLASRLESLNGRSQTEKDRERSFRGNE